VRARWLKPEFFTDKKIAALGMAPALVLEALGCVADDGGVAQCDALSLKGQMFMRWNELTVEVVERALVVLTEAGQVQHYSIEDRDFYQLLVWDEKAIHNPSKFRHPRPTKEVTPAARDALLQEVGSGEAVGSPSSPPIYLDSQTPRLPASQTPETTGNNARGPGAGENRSETEGDPEAHLAGLMPDEFRGDVRSFLKPMTSARRKAWASNLAAKLNGMHPPKIEPRIAGLALRQMLANGETNWKRFEGYCRLEAEGPPAVPENSGKRGTGRSGIEAEIKLAAAKQLEEIKKLRIGVQTVQGIKYHVPAQSLEELPPAVRSAIAALGGSLAAGAQRIIECPTDKYSILLGQFQTLYAGAVNTERARLGAHA
jgi:hypothetical protein